MGDGTNGGGTGRRCGVLGGDAERSGAGGAGGGLGGRLTEVELFLVGGGGGGPPRLLLVRDTRGANGAANGAINEVVADGA